MKEKFIINGDYIFSVQGNNNGEATRSVVFGDEDNRLEMSISQDSDIITSIDCVYVKNILNESIVLPDVRSDESIREYKEPSSYYNQKDVSGFVVNFNRDELDIILSESLKPMLFYIDDRIEYYYDENLDLIYIKVTNLTEEEYEYFKELKTSVNKTK